MPNPYSYRSPDTHLRHIQYARQQEDERAKRLDEQDQQRLLNIQGQMEVETQRSADLDRQDSVSEQMRFEQARSTELDRRDKERPPVSEWMPQRDEAAALRLDPRAEYQRGIQAAQERGESPLIATMGGRMPPQPSQGFNIMPPLEALDYPRQQLKERVIEPVVPDVDVTIPSVSVAAPPPVPWLREQVRETTRLAGAGIGAITGRPELEMAERVIPPAEITTPEVTITDEFIEEAASWVLDPLNVLPVVGWGPDILRAAKAGRPALKALLKNPEARALLDDVMRAGERGGPRVPLPGEELPVRPPATEPLWAAKPPPPESLDWQGVAARVSERIPEAQRTYKITDLARRAELGKRTKQYFGRLDELLREGMSGKDARKAAMAEFGGELPDVKFADALWISPEEVDALNGRVIQYMRESNHPLEANTAMDAITGMTAKRVPRPHEIRAIRKVFGDDLAKTIEKASRDKDTWKTLMDLWMVPKAIRSSFDLSFPFRQGIMVSGRHPLMFGNSIKTTARAFADPDWMARETTMMLADKTAVPVKMADGSSVDLMLGQIVDSMGIVVERAEPFYRGQLAERLWLIGPGVKRSNVAFTGAGNKLRYDMARYWLNRWTRPQSMVDVTPERLQSLGNLLNALTGRATIPKGQLFDLMQAAWWSPQYRLSGPQVLATGIRHGFFPGGDKEIAKIAAQNLTTFVAGGIGILSLLKTSGLADVEIDPRSTDFGKIRMGPTRINFWGTSQLLVRTIAQSITQTRLDSAVGPVATDPGQAWAKWVQSGLSPQISLIWDWATGEAYIGEPLRADERRGVSWEDIAEREAWERGLPLAWLDIKEGIEEDALRGGLVGAAGVLGLGVQSYDPASQGLRAIPRYEGLDARQSYEISRFARKSEARLDELRLEFGTGVISDADRKMMLFNIALEMGMDEETAAAAAVLTSSDTTQKELLNPEWLKFVLQNWDELRVTNPELAMSNYILEARERAKEEGLIK